MGAYLSSCFFIFSILLSIGTGKRGRGCGDGLGRIWRGGVWDLAAHGPGEHRPCPGAVGLRRQLLNKNGPAGPGTGAIRQERMMRSRLSGPCGSAVKAAPHPESGASFSPSCCSAALCSSRVTPTAPTAWSSPGIRPVTAA